MIHHVLAVLGPPGQFSCNVTCPPMPFTAGLSDRCTVQWTRPQTASCGPVTGYNVAITTVTPSIHVTASSFTHETVALEPFNNYTATVTAMNSLGQSSCFYKFITSKEDRKYYYINHQCQNLLKINGWKLNKTGMLGNRQPNYISKVENQINPYPPCLSHHF